MPRRIVRGIDYKRTAALGIDELFVQKEKSDDNHFYTWQLDPDIDVCPNCGSAFFKPHNLFHREYVDVITADSTFKTVTLFYEFYKYRCLNPKCGSIFSKQINFASVYDNVTYRLEDTIAHLVIKGYSYGEISSLLSYSLTKQAIGNIFNRWVRRRIDRISFKQVPKCLAVISGVSKYDQYTLFLNLDGGIRIFDAIFGVNSLDIAAWLRNTGLTDVDTLISDCDPTIYDVINDNLQENTYIIPIDYWFKLVRDDFAEYSHEILKWCTVKNKNELILKSKSELGFRSSDLEMLIKARPEIEQPYRDYNELKELIKSRDEEWTYNKIQIWAESVCPDFKKELGSTILRLNTYKEAIYQHELHPELVPENLAYLTDELERTINNGKSDIFSDACLKAKILFSVPADLGNWQGVPIEEVINTLQSANTYGGNIYDYK